MFVRRRNRLRDKTLYEANYWYFVTICVSGRVCVMNILTDTELQNDNTQNKTTIEAIIRDCLFEVVENCADIYLDYWVIMPNHIHFIVAFGQNPTLIKTSKKLSLGDFIKSFKLSLT